MVRAGAAGQFVFSSVPAGLYLLTAIRAHYFPASYGQRLPHGQGTPIEVTSDSSFFSELRLRRMGAITGRVLDENGIGLPDVPVVAYRARFPLRIAASAVSDDRGVYRIHGLDPGRYWVRTGAHTLEGGTGLLPTFSPEAGETRDARAYPVDVDTEATDADFHVIAGVLFRLRVTVNCQVDPALVLATETGRRSIPPNGGFVFYGLAPAPYEVYAECSGQKGKEFGFTEMSLDRDTDTGVIETGPLPRVRVTIERPGGGPPLTPVSLTGRRQDLAGTGPQQEIRMPYAELAPGHWEIQAETGSGEYVESVSMSTQRRRISRPERSTDAFEVFVESRLGSWMKVVVSDKAGHISGAVQTEDDVVPGIPVFLWPVAEEARRSLRGARVEIADVDGQFQFDGLPPGDYRLLATFDLSEVDEQSMEAAHAPVVHVEPSETTDFDLTPWAAPF